MDTNPPAFPLSTIDGYATDGMTLRDWFAGMALQGLIIRGIKVTSEDLGVKFGDLYSSQAYEYADAMIEQRSKK